MSSVSPSNASPADTIAQARRASSALQWLVAFPGLSLVAMGAYRDAAPYLVIGGASIAAAVYGLLTQHHAIAALGVLMWLHMIRDSRKRARLLFSVIHVPRVLQAGAAASLAKATTHTPPCARCASAPRTSSGFCTACTTVLRAAVPDGSSAAFHFYEACERRDRTGAQRELWPIVSFPMRSGRQWRRAKRVVLQEIATAAALGQTSSRLELSVHDPENERLIWQVEAAVSEGNAAGQGAGVSRNVARFQIARGRIRQIVAYPPLPPA